MAASAAVHTFGATLSRATTSNGSYTAVAEVRTYKWSGKRGAANATHLLSPSQLMEKVPKFGDPGEITFTCNHTNAAFSQMYADWKAGTQLFWKLTLADTHTLTPFKAHVSDLTHNTPEDDIHTFDVSLDCTGDGAAYT